MMGQKFIKTANLNQNYHKDQFDIRWLGNVQNFILHITVFLEILKSLKK